jgi:hypothetical protein
MNKPANDMKIVENILGALILVGGMSFIALVCWLFFVVIPKDHHQNNIYEQERYAKEDADEAVFRQYRDIPSISRCHLTATGDVTCNLYLGDYRWISARCTPRINNTLLVDATRCRLSNTH